MECPKPSAERLKNRRFVPTDIDLYNINHVKPLFDELLNRKIRSAKELEQYILDVSELSAAVQEEGARTQLATSRNTADESARKLLIHYQEKILGVISPLFDKLDEKMLQSEFLKELNPKRYGNLIHVTENQHRLFDPRNIPLSIEDAQLGEKYNAVAGGMTVTIDGKEMNLTRASQILRSTNRGKREEAWRAIAGRRKESADEIDDIYDRMLRIRHQIARNAGFDNFRDYQHKNYNRFDYTPEDCYRFHETIEKQLVPVVRELREKRKARLGIESVRPWDVKVDPEGREPLHPFKTDDELIQACTGVLDRIYPKLGDNLRLLKRHDNLDLVTRKDKAPVGFNMPLAETGVSFIFMNATGTHSDFMVLLHESGHAIETRACASEPIMLYRNTPQEWGECASQAMELLGLDHLDVLYEDPEIRARCIREKLEDTIMTIVSSAQMDAFQHWVYLNPDHTRDARHEKWVELSQRFSPGIDYSGIEDVHGIQWQAVPHLFIVPFYYIEYGISQLGAIQVYRNARIHGKSAIKQWLDTMKFGYSLSIPELYRHAGLSFQLHGKFVEELLQFLTSELSKVT